MADKTPVRVVFNASNVATGMAEFQTGESVPVANGGTGLTAVGSAGQVLKVNGAGTGLEFGAEGDISITNLVAPTNADLTLTTSGTGNIILDAITVRGTTISSADSSTININDNVEIDGNLVVTGTVDFNDQNISNVGSLSIDSISGDADTNTSITFSGSDVITIATGGAGRLTISDGALAPVTNNQIDLGTSSLEFKDAFFTGTVTSDAFAGPLTGNVTGTADVATVATTVTISDNESTNESNVILFAAGAAGSGNLGVEADGNMTYNPSTGIITATGFAGALTGNVTGNTSGTAATVTGAAQTNITSVGTLTALQVDNLNLNGNAITSTAGTDLTITPVAGQQIVLDGTIVVDAGVVTGATSITSDVFVGALTGNATGTAATVTGAAQTNITSLGTLTTLTVDNVIINGTTIGHTSDTDAIAIGSDGDVTLTQDLELQHDGAILSFGADDEIAITHVHDTGILVTDVRWNTNNPVTRCRRIRFIRRH